MLKASQKRRLATESRDGISRREFRSNQLDRDRAPWIVLLRLVDDTHSTDADSRAEGEGTDAAPDELGLFGGNSIASKKIDWTRTNSTFALRFNARCPRRAHAGAMLGQAPSRA